MLPEDKDSAYLWDMLDNVISHEYGEIKQERIWTVVSSNIPELIEKLEPLVKPGKE